MFVIDYRSSIWFKHILKIDILDQIDWIIVSADNFLHFKNLITDSNDVLFKSTVNFNDVVQKVLSSEELWFSKLVFIKDYTIK